MATCGHNAAGWSCIMRAMGLQFDNITMAQANVVNVHGYVGDQNERIGLPRDDATWLTGDQVLELVALDNPDNPGTPAAWMKGPAPLNYFYTFFAETLADQSHHNTVHIMVVNTATVTGPMWAAMGGVHWFTAAWLVEAEATDAD